MSHDRQGVRPTAWLKSASKNAIVIGKKILAAFDRGRQKAIQQAKEQARFWRRIIGEYVLLDMADGHSSRGRSRRICERLRGKLSRRQVQRYLDTLMSLSSSTWQSGASPNFTGGLTA